MSGLHGPNTAQLEGLLERVKRLTHDQWRELVATAIKRGTDHGTAEVVRAADAAAMRHRRNPALDAALEAVGRSIEVAATAWRDCNGWMDTALYFDLARLTTAALVLRDVTTRNHFRALYAPFARLIPPESLRMAADYGRNTAQLKRLFKKVRKLTPSQSWQVLELHQARDAQASEVHRGLTTECIDAARIDARVMAGVSWDDATQWAEGDAAREAAKSAVEEATIALLIQGDSSPDLVVSLYAPFARTIPTNDLTGGRAWGWLRRHRTKATAT